VWPPVARNSRAFAAMVWLGFASLLLLVPSMGGVATQLQARGPQTLLPSLEAAYPWVLALLGTSLFSGLGVARRTLGGASFPRPRLLRGVALAVLGSVAVATVFSSVAIANELALRDRPAADSRFGPTDPRLEPPICAEPPRVGRAARVDVFLTGLVDTRPTGTVDVRGVPIDGVAFRAAFPEIEHLVGDAGLERWRGELDYWVFADGEVGRVAGSVNCDAASIGETGLQGTLRATMTAIERDRDHTITRPAG